MKKINLLLLFLLLACTLPAQDGISIFIGRANRYAAVELSDYRKRLCPGIQYFKPFLGRLLQTLWKRLGNVGIALEVARTSGKRCMMYAIITTGINVTDGTVFLWRLA